MFSQKYDALLKEIKLDALEKIKDNPVVAQNVINEKYFRHPLLEELSKEDPSGELMELIGSSYSLAVELDQDPLNPREDYDNIGAMWCRNSKYTLGDKKGSAKFIDMIKSVDNISDEDLEILENLDVDKYASEAQIALEIAQKYDVGIIKPLYLYDHSGISISTGGPVDRWDSSLVGVVFASNEAIKNECDAWTDEFKNEHYAGKTDKEIISICIDSEVSTYDDYLTGSVYAFSVKCDGDVLASCGSFFGNTGEEEALSAGREEMELAIIKELLISIVDEAMEELKTTSSMSIFQSKVAGAYDGELFGAIQMIAASAKESGVSPALIFAGIAGGDEAVMSLFAKA
jgi:hypothetical protein